VDVLADAGIGPVDEMEVEVVEAESGQRFLGAGDRLVEAVVTAGDLRGDEELLTVDGGVRDRLADFALVLVVDRRIEQAVADGVDGVHDRVDALGTVHRIDAETELRDRAPVVEVEGGDGRTVRWSSHGSS